MPSHTDTPTRFTVQPRKPELLAPAGSLEAFFAAMEKGADAVYAGLSEFSARARARNFSLPVMARIVNYAHSHGKKIYVTLNTLIKEAELPHLIETLAALQEMRADGVIIQDLAIARLVRNYFPSLPLHASTQLTIHNTFGVRQLEDLGFERVVLARELHLKDIQQIVSKCQAEIEVFVHGALCFSISGQCFFSSFLGGHSGNRGRCTQPCRRQYSHRGKDGFYFSPNDLSAIDLIPQLAQAGVASLKIEGRMKSAEYVAGVVEAYRLLLDTPAESFEAARNRAKSLLKSSFGRVPTKGFLVSHSPTDIATPSLSGATGRFLGHVTSVRNGRITFETRDRLHIGDRIRIQPQNDQAGRGFTVKELFVGKSAVKAVSEKSIVSTVSPFACRAGDSVFKVSSETAFTMSESACLRRLDSAKPVLIPCDLNLAFDSGTLKITGHADGIVLTEEYPLGTLDPSRSADMSGILSAQFSKCGDTPFRLTSLAAPDFPSVMIPLSRLKELRREFFRRLFEAVTANRTARRRVAQSAALSGLSEALKISPSRQPELIVRTDSLRDIWFLQREDITAVSLTVSRGILSQLFQFKRSVAGREYRIWWRLPFFINEDEIKGYQDAVREIVRQGFCKFEVANLAHFYLLKSAVSEDVFRSMTLVTDYRLFSLNSQSLLMWNELGATAATLYIEDDADNLKALLAADVPIRRYVILYAPVPVITSRIGIKSVRDDSPVQSDRGEGYKVTQKDGLTVITAAKRLSLVRQKNRLIEMGSRTFIVDLSEHNREEKERILEAVKHGAELPGTSEFNFTSGLV